MSLTQTPCSSCNNFNGARQKSEYTNIYSSWLGFLKESRSYLFNLLSSSPEFLYSFLQELTRADKQSALHFEIGSITRPTSMHHMHIIAIKQPKLWKWRQSITTRPYQPCHFRQCFTSVTWWRTRASCIRINSFLTGVLRTPRLQLTAPTQQLFQMTLPAPWFKCRPSISSTEAVEKSEPIAEQSIEKSYN